MNLRGAKWHGFLPVVASSSAVVKLPHATNDITSHHYWRSPSPVLVFSYVNILQLGRDGEAILLNVAKDSIKKYRQQLRKTFGIPGREHDSDEFIQNMH